jgi:hypothetical protein
MMPIYHGSTPTIPAIVQSQEGIEVCFFPIYDTGNGFQMRIQKDKVSRQYFEPERLLVPLFLCAGQTRLVYSW